MGEIDGQPVMLAKPQTFMNLSGTSLAPLMEKHGIGSADLMVVYDELDLPWGGAADQAEGLGGRAQRDEVGDPAVWEPARFVRVRLGIHPGHPIRDGAEFVLAPVKRSQKKELDELVGCAADAVRSIIAEGVEKAMTKFNRRAPGLTQRKHERFTKSCSS